jgi:hypothetical protein
VACSCEIAETKIPYVSNGVVKTRGLFQQQADLAENTLKALVERLAFILAPANKPGVVNAIMERLKISDSSGAELGHRDLVQIIYQKPYVSLAGFRNIQRLMKFPNPVVAKVKMEGLMDHRPLKKLEEKDFSRRAYGAYGVK